MQIEQRTLDTISPYPGNPRCNDAAVAPVASSIQAFGWRQPIVIDESGVIIAGHTRYWAARLLELTEVPVHIATDLTPEQVRAYRLADNKTGEYATWDNDKLHQELAALAALDIDLALTGFSPDELQTLQAAFDEASETNPENDPEDCPDINTETVSKRGDVWQLGLHRLVCGDATNKEDVIRLLGEERADLGFTDPPYNVAYVGATEDKLTIQNDALSSEAFKDLLNNSLANYQHFLTATASLYIFHSWSCQNELQQALQTQGFVVRNQLIWAKNHFVQSFGRYQYQHEPLYYCYKKSESDTWYGDRKQTSLWHFDKPNANRVHPTMKPVALIEKALLNSSKPGDIILDLFGGSGSTLMACARLGRRARLLELDPKYSDVIIERWQTWSGQQAIQIETGLSYNSLKHKA